MRDQRGQHAGQLDVMVNTALPLVLALLSVRATRLPISLKSFGSFSLTSDGTGWRAASAASAPNVVRRDDARCVTTPLLTVMASAGTFHSCAAAATSMARAAAPAVRICSNEFAIAVLPPVPCAGPHNRLL